MEKHEFEEMFRQVMKEHYPELIKDYKPENKRWRAERGEKYWIVYSDGTTHANEEDNDRADENFYLIGNYFKTQEEAELYLKKQLITQQVKDIALRLGSPTEDDWKDAGVEKRHIAFNSDTKMFLSPFNRIEKYQGAIFCLDKNFLKVCLEEIGEEDLKLIFT